MYYSGLLDSYINYVIENNSLKIITWLIFSVDSDFNVSELAECCDLRTSLGVTTPEMKFFIFLADDDDISMEDFLNESSLSRVLCLLRL